MATTNPYLIRKKIAKYGAWSATVEMRGKHGKHRSGARHHAWKGGRYVDYNGYVLVKVKKGHYLEIKPGYAYEHRVKAAEKLGRRIKPDEHVHHRNGDKQDNSLSNIEIMSASAHQTLHLQIRRKKAAIDLQNGL